MPIFIRDKRVDRRLGQLAKRQRPSTSKEWLAGAVLDRVADLCENDPRAWESIGTAASISESAQQSEAGPPAIRENQQSPASKDASAPRGAQVSQPAGGTAEAGAAKSAA